MRVVNLTALTLTLAVFGLSAVRADETPAFKAEELVGEWEYVSGVKNGMNVDKERLVGSVTFTKDRITIPAGPDAKFVMEYKLDTKATPVAIDMNIKEGPVNEGKALGIVAIEKNELKFCYVPVMAGDEKRPAKFESTESNKAFFFVLKKKAAK